MPLDINDIVLEVTGRGLRLNGRAATEKKYRWTLASMAETGILPLDRFTAATHSGERAPDSV
ncbi:hypothetical protein [Sphingopyxis solisilvae]|uniref:hypothetical protein n=1 Tax=Sphingopyxis solisilvae TaxID=1886788 RepID=UPI001892A8AB|nr:hypothetical protein [Sphingopyxis solisilvae]